MEYPAAFLEYQEALSQRNSYGIQEAFVEYRETVMEHPEDLLEYQEGIQEYQAFLECKDDFMQYQRISFEIQ